MFTSTKRFGPISTCHRNWKAATNENRDSAKCSLIHGYARYIQLTFKAETMDAQGWVYDFGDCKVFKEWFEQNWDHKVLVSSDDPQLELLESLHESDIISLTVVNTEHDGWGASIEGSAKCVFDVFNEILKERTNSRVRISKVEVWEHENNTATYEE